MLKKTKKFGVGKFLVMALVLGGGLIYGTQMVQKNQENRSSAASTQKMPCKCSNPVYKTVYLCNKGKGKWICPQVTTKPTATPVPKKTCTTGEKLCKGNVSMICKNNTWFVSNTCDNGCRNGECIPKITSTPTPIKKESSSICGPTNNSCMTGNLKDVVDSNYNYIWTCGGKTCTLEKPEAGTCGSSVNQCVSGTLSDIADASGLYQWKCGTRICTLKKLNTACTSVVYSTWSSCKDGKQVRSIWEKNPSGCVVDNPVLSQSCSNL